ncbi:hypothetical protein GSI_06612 [Ganoderma sinense ZZ0214-1]|uniref:Uncharacterized protein n=1 Tax=Ganoderma sinense ZZ0214-1 TaxID=1077348 RepID=A0A2G8SEA4_9APHY|nr:hypothetical protein GSI_06612 [Ganoderma sinense ZZ0214-1]
MATVPSTGSAVTSSLNFPSLSGTNVVSGTPVAHPTAPLPSTSFSTTGDSSMASQTTGNVPTDSQSLLPTTANALSSSSTSIQPPTASSSLITPSSSTEGSPSSTASASRTNNTGSLQNPSAPSTSDSSSTAPSSSSSSTSTMSSTTQGSSTATTSTTTSTTSSSTTTTTSISSTSTISSSTTTTTSDTSASTSTTSSTTDTSTSTSTTDTSTASSQTSARVTVSDTSSATPFFPGTVVTTTLQSTIFVTTTNDAGQTVTSAPPFVTQTLTKTNSDGSPNVITIVAGNPTPISNNTNATQTSQFFRNKGAVAGVFLIVGLAAASIVLFIFFYIRRRRRNQRLEHDAAVASTLAAAGFNRRPLDDDEEKAASPRRSSAPPSATMSTFPNSSFSSGALNLAVATGARPPTADSSVAGLSTPGPGADFDPYAALGTPPPAVFPSQARKDGYLPARTASPPPGSYDRTRRQTQSTSTSASWGHAAKGSVASTEPLLAGYYSPTATEPSTPAMGTALSLAGEGGKRDSSLSASSVYSADESEVPEMRPRLEVRNNTPSMRAPSMRVGPISRESSRRG